MCLTSSRLLKVCLYIPIEPKISGPITPPLGRGGGPLWGGVAVVQCRYLPKMKEVRQTFGRNQHTLPKLGPMGHFGPHNSPIGRQMGLKFGRYISFAKFDRDCSKLPIPSHTTQNFRPHNSPSGRRGRPLGHRLLLSSVQRYVPAKNELNRFTPLARDHGCHGRTDTRTFSR